MQYQSFIFQTAVALAAIVNVALAAPSDPNLHCAAVLSNISPAMDNMRIAASRWEPSHNYDGFLKIQALEQRVEQTIQDSRAACNFGTQAPTFFGIPTYIEYNALVPYVEDLMDTLIQKKAEFDSVPKVTPTMTSDIHDMFLKTYYLEQDLLAAAPDNQKEKAQESYHRIDHAFSSAYHAYGIY
ncbi:hypothetical protein K492DRAFT_188903 [Lichtheimia hyalospora FSU 10163]|nr:hypothetical protein K492DRAFT_188903 [Lichtheimia hyalospora FSU 10163]